MVPRIVVAGTGSGVGKTMIATGLMRRLSHRMTVQGFKVGPDFIDPMFHHAATGRLSRNLDSFFLEPPVLRNLFGWATRDADIAIIEGVRGLYDGLTATGDAGSTAEIAKMLGAPVILVVNARSLAKSAAAHVLGFKALDPEVRIAGVILNKVGGARHRAKAVEAVESLTGVEVIGTIGRDINSLPENNLGLTPMEGMAERRSLEQMETMTEGIDLDRLIELASTAGEVDLPSASPYQEGVRQGVKIAVPRDRAYCFYYPENIEAIRAAGAEIVNFRPVEGEGLPACDGIYLGGGYLENHARAITDNRDFLEGVKTLSEDGGMIYGECGGLMTMCSSLRVHGEGHNMVGIFPSTAMMIEERQGPSYVRAVGTADHILLPGQAIRGHEFHYSRLVPPPAGRYGLKMERGIGISGGMDGITVRRSMGTYMHIHALSVPAWAPALVAAAGQN